MRAAIAYVVPTFVIAYAWHLVVFADRYEALAIYRDDVLVPLGLATILVQGAVFGTVYARLFGHGPRWRDAVVYGGAAAALSWSFTTLAVTAKFPMASIPDFVALETAFTAVQFSVVGPLTAWFARR